MSALMDDLADLTPEQRELLALLLEEQGVELQASTDAPTSLVPRKQPGEDAPLSFSQARLWFLDQLEPNSPMYNMPAAARIRGTLSAPALQASLDEIVGRHEILRTIFVRGEDGEPIQHVLPHLTTPIETTDLTALPADVQEAEVVRLASAEVQRPFDLARGPLVRVTLLVLSQSDFLLLVNMHHIVTDGWSLGVFIRELAAAYTAFVQGLSSPLPPTVLPPLPLQYGDYALWQRETLQGHVLEEQLAYWREALEGAPAVIELPLDRPRPAVQTHRGNAVDLVIPGRVQAAMNQLAQAEGATLFMTLLAAFQVFLYRYSRMTDICVGTPIANRTRGELEALIGFFTNTLVIRGQLTPQMPFRQFLHRIREVTLAAYDHQDVPFEQVVEAVHPERTMSYSPLFQVMFALQQWQGGGQQAVQLPGITLEGASFPSVTAKFDLTLNLSESGAAGGAPGGIAGSIEYNSDLFDLGTIERMAQNLLVLIEAIAAEPDRAVGDLRILTDAERELVIEAWNRTEMPFPDDRTIHSLIAEWAESTPDAIAAEFVELTHAAADGFVATTLTYRQLHERANRLAHHLQRLGVGPDTLVGLSVTRSLDMIAGVLGILTAGGAYVPLDPNYPSDRLGFMIADSGMRILVTQAALETRLPLAAPGVPPDLTVVRLDEDWTQIAQQPATVPDTTTGGDSLAYCIYTSGSTGRPKGTPVRHRGVCSLATAGAPDLDMRPGQRMLQFAAFSFDASVWEITMTLRNGATLILASQETLTSGPELLKLLELARVTTVILPPALAAVLEPPTGALPELSTVISGGDRVTNQMVKHWARGAEGRRRFINAYGPTEITVCATLHPCDPDKESPFGGPPIGRPLANTRCYIAAPGGGEKFQAQPIGVPGELLIAGVGVTQGYLNRPELTAEKFVPNPFDGTSGYYSRVYRTGDLVRWLPTGEIEFLGRIDDQVKVRGFRIELGEIEAVLRQHPAVQDAVVTARGETLAGYYIPRATEAGDALTATELRSHLRGQLPEYMVPALFVQMAAFPLSPANKVDRRRLPAPDHVVHAAGREYVAPRTPTEEVLAGIWTQLLHEPRPSGNDNFFELGGHSLSSTQLVSRVRSAFGLEMPLRSLFDAPTLAGLAATIDRLRAEATDTVAPPISPLPRRPDTDGKVRLPLSFAQQRLWFLDQLEPGGSLYNIPTAIRLTGNLDLGALRGTLDALVRRHETLRTTFETIDGKGFQVIEPADTARLDVRIVDLAATPRDEREAAAMRAAVADAQLPFDLAQGPLTRVTLLKLADDDHMLLITMHHIISDGWSSQVVEREFGRLYAAYASGEATPELPHLSLQYADYAGWQREWLDGAIPGREGEESSPLKKLVAYWRKQLEGVPALLELPADRPRPATASHRGAGIEFELPHELVEQLRKISRDEGVTLFMTLMAAYQTLLFRLTGQKDFCVGTPVANRTWGELEGIVGFFVNTLVMRAGLSGVNEAGAPNFLQLVRRVRTTALDAYAHQDAPFEKLIDGLKVTRDLSHSPLFQVMFVFHQQQGNGSGGGQLPGLTLAPVPIHGGTTPFDLTLVLAESAGALTGFLEYSTDLFEKASAESFVRYFRTLLQGIADAPERPISTIELLTPQERDLILRDWNDTTLHFPDLCLHEVFEQQAAEAPGAPALLFVGEDGARREMNYAGLDAAANSLAGELAAMGVAAEQVVAISVEKSIEQIVAMLAVLKAGGAYLPIDPDYPRDRIEYMLRDSGARLVLTQSFLAQRFDQAAHVRVVCVDEFLQGPGAGRAERDGALEPVSTNSGADGTRPTIGAAYVIYTSGSTGRPKGVVATHRGVVNFALEYQRRLRLGPGERVLQFISFSFDASVGEMFGALLSGAELVLAPHEVLADPERLLRLLEDERIDFSSMPAAMLAALPRATTSYPHVVMSGGDACPPEVAARWLAAGGNARRFFNGYGPTEATVGPTMHEVIDPEAERHGVAIGRPIANMEAYVLDEEMQPVPPNVAGEIYLGGVGIARGYLGRPDLTADRFVPNPFADGKGPRADSASTRLYRTGDRGRWRRNGDLECLGRVDNQVKVRGYRVELGEIEAALSSHAGIRECVVVARETGMASKQLIAYWTSNSEPAPTITELRTHLLAALPDYMVPAIFVKLSALPLTANGKVDRSALPAPSEPERGDDISVLAPATPTEQILADIWSQVLGVRNVSVNDNFFELGGDSILSIQVVARANQAGLHLTPKQLFQSPTIAALAAAAGTAAPGGSVLYEQGPVVGEVTLTPIQRYFFGLDLANRNHWNQSVLLSVRAPAGSELEPAHLGGAIAALIEHHDALRMRFEQSEGEWCAVIPPYEPDQADAIPFERLDLSDLTADEFSRRVTAHATEVQKSLDISRGPLIRAVYYVAGADRPGRLLLVIHHLAVDGVSWRVLLQDLQTAYAQLAAGAAAQLPPKTTSIKTWAERLAAYAGSDTVLAELDGWLERVGGWVPPLPTDFEGSTEQNTEDSIGQLAGSLSAEETAALLTEANAAYNTEVPDLLLTALAQTIERWTGTPALYVHLEGHGREEIAGTDAGSIDLSRTVGWFTSLYPVRLDLPWGSGEGDAAGEALLAVKEQLRSIPQHGLGYGLLRHLGDEENAAALAAQPEPELSFNYLGQFDQVLTSGPEGASPLGPAPESSGHDSAGGNRRAHLVDITAAVAGGRLGVSWTYSRAFHDAATMQQVSDWYLEALRTLIAHCRSPQAGAYSPSDFPMAELDQKQLAKILNKVKKTPQGQGSEGTP